MDDDILHTEEQTRTKILTAVIDTLGSEGEQGITVRGIAAKAGVNPALVNYHFGTKDRLVSGAFRFLLSKNMKIFDVLKDRSLPARDRLVNFFDSFYMTISRYPGFLKTQITRLISGTFVEDDFVYLVGNHIPALYEAIFEMTGKHSRKDAVLRMMQTMPAIVLPTLISGTIKKYSGTDLDNPRTRKRYLNMLVDSIAPKEDTHE